MKIGVVGLGYVGLPLVVAFCQEGHEVTGVDADARVVEGLEARRSHIEDVPDSTLADIAGRFHATTRYADLAKVDAYERRGENRTTVLNRISTLRGDEPWAGYDELTVAEIRAALSAGDDDRAEQVQRYERGHKNRAGVLAAAEREFSNA